MVKIDLSIYKDVLRVRKAWCFDIGTVLIRMYSYMFTIGTVSMITLAGYSAFIGGTVAAVLSVVNFLVGPRIGRRIDEQGQAKVVPLAAFVSMVGLVGLISSVLFGLPLPFFYLFAALIGVSPSGQALARTRWTYLIRTGKFGAGSVDVRTAYSYEGVLEDAGFVVAPAINIALSAALHPVAGMVFGGLCLGFGVLILLLSKDTEPEIGWLPDVDGDGTGDTDPRFVAKDSPWITRSNRSVIVISGTVRVLFVCMLLIGVIFGSFDSTTVVYCQDLGSATMASAIMSFSGALSLVSSFVFGTLKIKSGPAKMLLITGLLYGLGYATSAFTFNAASLFVFTAIGSPFYAPFFITVNTVCERAVPSARLTEGITWMNAGLTCGFAIGPSCAGVLMDVFGSVSGYALVGVAGVAIPLFILCTRKVFNRELPAEE